MSVMFSLLMADSQSEGTISRIIRAYGYQTCEWVAASHAYIDTGLIPTSDIRLKCMPYLLNTSGVHYLFSCYGNANRITVRLEAEYTNGSLYVSNLGSTQTISKAGDAWCEIEMNPNGYVYIDGLQYSISRGTRASQTTLILFAYHTNASTIQNGSGAKMKGKVEIEQSGRTMTLYPCYEINNPNNIGYFDFESVEFHGKTGTGTLTKGEDMEYDE